MEEQNKRPFPHAYFIPMELDHFVVRPGMAKDVNHFAGQLADFSLLPHLKTGADCSMERIRPNISEDLVAKPFEATNDPLETGVHLRWTLPKEFRRARITDTETGSGQNPKPKFREIPNRWMIERRVFFPEPDSSQTMEHLRIAEQALRDYEYKAKKGEPGYDIKSKDYSKIKKEADALKQQLEAGIDTIAIWKSEPIEPRVWIIESDALSVKKENGSCAFPVELPGSSATGAPGYRYLGKVYEYNDWIKKDALLEAAQKEHREKRKAIQERQAAIRAEMTGLKNDILDLEAKQGNEKLISNKRENWNALGEQMGELLDEMRALGQEPKTQHVENLTAFGYGEPLFSAYYPECRNVFGFYDDLTFTVKGDKEQYSFIEDWAQGELEFRYVVTGWYADPVKDPMASARFKIWVGGRSEEIQQPEIPEDLRKYQGYPLGLLPEIDHGISEPIEEFFWLVSVLPTENLSRRGAWLKFLTENGRPDLDESMFRVEKNQLIEDQHGEFSRAARGRSIPIARLKNIIWPQESESKQADTDTQMQNVRVALGNTPGQALAALLAAAAGENKRGTELMLDSLQLGLFGEENKLDFPARLEAGLHEGGFISAPGESLWTIRTEQKTQPTALKNIKPENDQAKNTVTDIPDTWALRMQKLNALQRQADKTAFKLKDRQKQFYADWYKYMLAEYDYTLDEITTEAQVNDIRAYLSREVYKFDLALEAHKQQIKAIQDTVTELKADIRKENSKNEAQFRLQKIQGPRYWEPREPVVLLNGKDAVPNRQYPKRTSREKISLWPRFFSDPGKSPEQTLLDHIDNYQLHNTRSVHPFELNFFEGDKDNWSPLFMDWQVELFPFTKPGDKDFHQKDWPSDSVVAHYDLHENQTDLRLQENLKPGDKLYENWINNHPDIQIQAGKRLQTIEGRSILTADAHIPLIENLKKLLEEAALQGNKDSLEGLIEQLENLPLLSQSLSGFNDALLMRKQILQLQVKDPLARTDILYQFTQELNKAIGAANDVAPLPSNLFLPLREGAFRIRKIRLVDAWGRIRELEKENLDDKVIVAEPIKPPPVLAAEHSGDQPPLAPGMAYFPPRIVQPMRLNFRWMSAERPASDAGSFVADSPICGYIVPNFLDKSLQIHDAEGRGLAVLARSGEALVRNPFPGNKKTTEASEFNRHLDKFIDSIQKHGTQFLADLLETARRSMAETLPENYAQFDGMPLMVGRPLALVRAELNLELRGLPAINNSWTSRTSTYLGMERHTKTTMGFDNLRFAVRIGDKFKANDGFLAYFIDKPDQDVVELFSPYVQKGSKPAETFWSDLSLLENLKMIDQKRLDSREDELLEFKSDISALENQLADIFPAKNTADEQVESDHEIIGDEQVKKEVERLTTLIATKHDHRDLLQEEIESLQKSLEGKNADIEDLWKKHGNQDKGAGIFKPHSDLLTLSPAEDALKIGMLIDPRAAVHLTTGVLPVKRIDIPPEQFAQALNTIQIAFLTTPVISPVPDIPEVQTKKTTEKARPEAVMPAQKFFLVSPRQTGYQWSWLQPEGRKDFKEFAPENIVQPPQGFIENFTPQAIFEGWMKLLPDDNQDNNE